ncbi:hypothetical protein [Cytobacillus kochii]|uniref:Uncharacterized protein n=1 Tax=Cytobacillus kochii TaxID=859143 RepID=A0A248THD1_9BACI|nr:hypothetical protein [Cytobacillus kochii]ASV67591.1 hypothetical protein CKF48_09815 [Cytobacillus kochii]
MDILTDKKVKTRKTHVCHGCVTSYPPKTEMRYVTSIDGGEFQSAYCCQTCDEVIEKTYDYIDLQNGIGFGDVKDFDIPFWQGVHLKYQNETQ